MKEELMEGRNGRGEEKFVKIILKRADMKIKTKINEWNEFEGIKECE